MERPGLLEKETSYDELQRKLALINARQQQQQQAGKEDPFSNSFTSLHAALDGGSKSVGIENGTRSRSNSQYHRDAILSLPRRPSEIVTSLKTTDISGNDEEKQRLAMAEKYHVEYDAAVRESMRSLEREEAVEKKRRLQLEAQWERNRVLGDTSTNPLPIQMKEIKQEWKRIDEAFLKRKKDIVETVAKSFEVKLMYVFTNNKALAQEILAQWKKKALPLGYATVRNDERPSAAFSEVLTTDDVSIRESISSAAFSERPFSDDGTLDSSMSGRPRAPSLSSSRNGGFVGAERLRSQSLSSAQRALPRRQSIDTQSQMVSSSSAESQSLNTSGFTGVESAGREEVVLRRQNSQEQPQTISRSNTDSSNLTTSEMPANSYVRRVSSIYETLSRRESSGNTFATPERRLSPAHLVYARNNSVSRNENADDKEDDNIGESSPVNPSEWETTTSNTSTSRREPKRELEPQTGRVAPAPVNVNRSTRSGSFSDTAALTPSPVSQMNSASSPTPQPTLTRVESSTIQRRGSVSRTESFSVQSGYETPTRRPSALSLQPSFDALKIESTPQQTQQSIVVVPPSPSRQGTTPTIQEESTPNNELLAPHFESIDNIPSSGDTSLNSLPDLTVENVVLSQKQEALLREIIVPQIVDIFESNHLAKSSDILPTLLKSKETTLKRVLNKLFHRKSSVASISSSSNSNNGTIKRQNYQNAQLNGNVFGKSLEDLVSKSEQEVPHIITRCVEWIEQNAMQTHGLFRISCPVRKVEALRTAFDRGDEPDFLATEPHAVAGLLKQFYRDLREPLCLSRLTDVWLECGGNMSENIRFDLVRHMIFLLPKTHRVNLRYLLLFLNRLSKHANQNNMDTKNLATCIGPNLIRLRADEQVALGQKKDNTQRMDEVRKYERITTVVTLMIERCHDLFELPDAVRKTLRQQLEKKKRERQRANSNSGRIVEANGSENSTSNGGFLASVKRSMSISRRKSDVGNGKATLDNPTIPPMPKGFF